MYSNIIIITVVCMVFRRVNCQLMFPFKSANDHDVGVIAILKGLGQLQGHSTQFSGNNMCLD